MNILEVTKYHYATKIGGVEKVVQVISEGLAKKGNKVVVLACRASRGKYEVRHKNGVILVYAGSYGNFWSMPLSISFFYILRKLSDKADVVHWHEPFPLASVGLTLLARRSTRIVTWHGDIVRQKLIKPIMIWLQKRALKTASVVVATSPNLVSHSQVLSQSPFQVQAIPLGVPISSLLRVDAETETDWLNHRRPAKRYALFVGRLTYYKGIHVVIPATAKSKVILVIVGQGALLHWARKAILDIGASNRILLIDRPVCDQEIKLFYKYCEFLVFPSTEPSEAFGLVQAEAMAFGKPIINTMLPTGVPFVSLHGETGLTVPVGDVEALASAMDLLWCDDRLRRSMGEKARVRAFSQFDQAGMVDKYWSLIQNLRDPVPGSV